MVANAHIRADVEHTVTTVWDYHAYAIADGGNADVRRKIWLYHVHEAP